MPPSHLPTGLKGEGNGGVAEGVPLAVDGAQRDPEVVRILLRQLRNVIGNLVNKKVTSLRNAH